MPYHPRDSKMNRTSEKHMRSPALIIGVLILLIVVTGYIAHALQPCPTVVDTTIGVMAQNWASSLTSPFTQYVEDKFKLILKQKTMPGVWGQADQIYGMYAQFDNLGVVLEREVANIGSSRLDWLKSMAGASTGKNTARGKLGTLQLQATVNVFTGGKNALKLAEDTEPLMKNFSPLQFDFASKSQVQKDMAKIARIQARTQAEILGLLSAIKMQEELTK